MKKTFWLGLLTGVLFCTLMFGLAACAFVNKGDDEYQKSEIVITGNEMVDALNRLGYQDKVNSLAAMLDYYYYEDFDAEQLADGIYAGLVSSLGDIYTTYYTPEQYKEFMESSTGIYAGIGSSVTQDAEGNITLVKPFKGGPAYEGGLLPGDIIVEINDESVSGLDLTGAVNKIKGEPGSTVKLKIYRAGELDYLEFELVRANIEVPTVEYQMLEDGIGYIYVMEFDEVTEEQFFLAVDALEEQGMKALVVDVRDNPGGMLTTVCAMLSRILPKGELLLYTEDKYGQSEKYYSDKSETVELPIAVVMNGASASASEVFAGALQDHDKAILVGTQSFGKGIVQSLVPIRDGSAIKVTVSKYFTPDGVNIHGTGLTPDIIVELDDELRGQASIPVEDDNQIQAAVDALKDQLK